MHPPVVPSHLFPDHGMEIDTLASAPSAANTSQGDSPISNARLLRSYPSYTSLEGPNGRILPHSTRRRSKTHSTDQPYNRYRPQHSTTRSAGTSPYLTHTTYTQSPAWPESVSSSGASTGASSSPLLPSILDHSFEERKPILGHNGSPHPPSGLLLPPMSPSPSARSGDSPIGGQDYDPNSNNHPHHRFSQPSSSEPSPSSLPYALPPSSVHDTLSNTTPFHHHSVYSSHPPSFSAPSSNTYMPTTSDQQHAGNNPHAQDSYHPNNTHMPTAREQQLELEISRLQNKVREVEYLHEQDRQRLFELQSTQDLAQELSNDVGAQFRAGWQDRTEARYKKLCSLNRAGNALCQWHDSRRERRQYPPRMAPSGVLNCGCTYEEALFEESLARHGVGAYLPGDSVRMDPVLRNALLRLLQERYNYRDGDFDRIKKEAENGEEYWVWPENDDAKAWIEGTAMIGNGKRLTR
jgi:hypothetical protein